METMRYSETKKSSKGFIFAFILFVGIGGSIIYLSMKSETAPKIIGQTTSEVNRLVNLDEETENLAAETLAKNSVIEYKVENKTYSDNSNVKIKSSMILPVISVDGEKLEEINSEIDKRYTQLFDSLKSSMASVNSKYTFRVSYNKYENMVDTEKILSLTIYQRVQDDSAKTNTTEKVETYNIDLATKKILNQSDVSLQILGKEYKTIIKSAVKDYVVEKGMAKESEFTYATTGIENFYIKDSKFHIVFNEGQIVDAKYGVLDITIN